MSRVAPLLFYIDKGIVGSVYRIEKLPDSPDYVNIWIKPKNSFKAVKLEKPIENRHIKRMYPTDTSTKGVVEEIWLVYTAEDNSLVTGIFNTYKEDVEDQIQQIKNLKQKITTLENQNRVLTSGAAKAFSSMKEAIGKDKQNNNSFGGNPYFNRFNNDGGF
jgi:spermidine/putrescine-binding protein